MTNLNQATLNEIRHGVRTYLTKQAKETLPSHLRKVSVQKALNDIDKNLLHPVAKSQGAKEMLDTINLCVKKQPDNMINILLRYAEVLSHDAKNKKHALSWFKGGVNQIPKYMEEFKRSGDVGIVSSINYSLAMGTWRAKIKPKYDHDKVLQNILHSSWTNSTKTILNSLFKSKIV